LRFEVLVHLISERLTVDRFSQERFPVPKEPSGVSAHRREEDKPNLYRGLSLPTAGSEVNAHLGLNFY
jgi:hypothetical protein